MSRIDDSQVLDLLSSLVDKSLVVYEEDARGLGRYRLSETVRQYGRDALAESGEAQAVRARQFDFFFALAEVAEDRLTGPEQTGWLNRMEAEHDNLRAALDWSLCGVGKVEAGLCMAVAESRFWAVRGHLEEGRLRLAEALERSPARTLMRARACVEAGRLAHVQGDAASAVSLYEAGMAIAREIGDDPTIALALNGLGNVALRRRDHFKAQEYYEASLEAARRLGNDLYIAGALNNLGIVAARLGDYDRARRLCEESVGAVRAVGDRQAEAGCLINLGCFAADQGDDARAKTLLRQGLEISAILGDRLAIIGALDEFARLAARQEPFSAKRRALRLWAATESLRQTIGTPLSQGGQARQQAHITEVQSSLGEDAARTEWSEGQALTLEQAVAYALAGEEAG